MNVYFWALAPKLWEQAMIQFLPGIIFIIFMEHRWQIQAMANQREQQAAQW